MLGDGRYGFGEAVISEGYSHETVNGGLRWCRDAAPCLVGKSVGEARALLEPGIANFLSAASSLPSALDVLDGHPLLDVPETTRVPLLDPVHSHEPSALADEIEALIARGFRTLKVKVGFDTNANLERPLILYFTNTQTFLYVHAPLYIYTPPGPRLHAGGDLRGVTGMNRWRCWSMVALSKRF